MKLHRRCVGVQLRRLNRHTSCQSHGSVTTMPREYLGRCSPQLCQYLLPKTEHMELKKAWSQEEAESIWHRKVWGPGCSVPGSWERESSTAPTPTPTRLDFPRISS